MEKSWSEKLAVWQKRGQEPQKPLNTIPSLNSSLININIKPSLNKPSINTGYKPIDKQEFARIAKQLTLWGVTNSGAVIKREGAHYVRQAVDITLLNLDKAKSPKAYFRGVLKNLQTNNAAC